MAKITTSVILETVSPTCKDHSTTGNMRVLLVGGPVRCYVSLAPDEIEHFNSRIGQSIKITIESE